MPEVTSKSTVAKAGDLHRDAEELTVVVHRRACLTVDLDQITRTTVQAVSIEFNEYDAEDLITSSILIHSRERALWLADHLARAARLLQPTLVTRLATPCTDQRTETQCSAESR